MMQVLTVTLLFFAMMAPSETAEAEAANGIAPLIQEGKSHLVKRCTSCPTGWTGYNGRCFRYIQIAMTWARAERKCQYIGANLTSVHSAEEYHEIQKMIATVSHGNGPTWIGGSDAQAEGIWLWNDGSPFNYRYCGGFDNYGGTQHCLQMNYGANKCWDATWCHIRLPFVCAKKPC